MAKLKQDIQDNKVAIIIVLIYCVIMQFVFGGLCPFKMFLHVDCPGCGLTRAAIALLKGNIRESLHYNYTCIFWLVTIALFFIDRYVKPLKIKPFPTLFIITSIITLIRYVLLMFFHINI